MDITLILGKVETDFVTNFNGSFKQLPRFSSDEERHDFVDRILKPIDFDKLIILIDSEDGYDALKLGLHIRLTVQLEQKRFVPILFVASESLKIILRQTGTWGRILTTKGCSLLPVDIQAVKDGSTIPSLAPAEFSEFLRRIQLQPDETIGRHSLANQWGAYILDKAARTKALLENKSLLKARKQLYFKYVEALNTHSQPVSKTTSAIVQKNQDITIQIKANGKKILLIDDEADKGWSDVLRQLFITTNPATDFAVLNQKVSGWSSYLDKDKDYILKTGFDLFLIDLRLTGTEEEETVEADKFSGTKVMQEIKKSNKGNQVIIFTASNKAWNLKTLLDLGANGYYIKESPEYNFSESFSVENFNRFKTEAEFSLGRSFLREIYLKTIELKENLKEKRNKRNINKELEVEFSRYLDYSYNSIENYISDTVSQRSLSMAYTFYFLILEATFKQLIDYSGERNGNSYTYSFRQEGRGNLYNFDHLGRRTNKILTLSSNDGYVPTISYKQQLFNILYFAGISSNLAVDIVNIRNKFQHPDLTQNNSFTLIQLLDILNIFTVVNKIIVSM